MEFNPNNGPFLISDKPVLTAIKNSDETISVYHPANNLIKIEQRLWLKYNSYQLFNLQGLLVKSGILKSPIEEVEVSQFEKGFYLLLLTGENSLIQKVHLK